MVLVYQDGTGKRNNAVLLLCNASRFNRTTFLSTKDIANFFFRIRPYISKVASHSR